MMGHSIGISDSYYRITETELLEDYLKATELLTINENSILQRQLTELSQSSSRMVNAELQKRDQEIKTIKEKELLSFDVISSLSDQILRLEKEIEHLKQGLNRKAPSK
jgi:hypothetical protein